MMTTEQEVNIRKLATMIREVKVAMLTTIRARPNFAQQTHGHAGG